MLDQRSDQVLRVRERRERLLALGDVATDDDRALALARRPDQRRTVQLVITIRLHANRLRKITIPRVVEDRLGLGHVLPQRLADQFVLRRFEQLLRRFVRADDFL